jgi:hypothetical protein
MMGVAARPGTFQYSSPSIGLAETCAALWTLGLSALAGFLAAFIFDRTRPAAGAATSSRAAQARAQQIVEQELQR